MTMPEKVRGPRGPRQSKSMRKTQEEETRGLALAGFEAPIGLVDHVEPAAAANHPAIPMALAQRLQRILDLHYTPSIRLKTG